MVDSAPDIGECVIAERFESFESFAKAARRWDLDFRQLDPGRFEAELTHVVTRTVILARCRLNRKVEQRGTPPAGYRTFGLGADDRLDITWRGKRVGPRHLMIFPAGEPLDSVTGPGFHVFAISVSEEALSRAAARRGIDHAETVLPEDDLAICSAELLGSLRSLAGNLTEAASSKPGWIRNRWFRISLEEDLPDLILDAIDHSSSDQSRPPASPIRQGALRAALELIEARGQEPVSIAEIERLSGASGRTLRYAFEERFGLSPKQYLGAYRLNRVRSELLRAECTKASVRAIAEKWGFWHMGQFAADYRRMFGDYPSDSLRKKL